MAVVAPSATSRPLTSTTTRGAMRSTSCSTCELTSTVRPALAEVAHEVDDVAALLRVEAVERLVEQQHLGVVGQRLGELDALAVALREHPHGPAVVGVEVDLAAARGARPPRGRRRRAGAPASTRAAAAT